MAEAVRPILQVEPGIDRYRNQYRVPATSERAVGFFPGESFDLPTATGSAKTQNAIPNCELVQLDSGHLPHLERPDELIRVMNAFLKD